MIDGSAAGSQLLGGGAGADIFILATGDVSFNAPIDLTGNGLDAQGGGVDVDTDGDITQVAPIAAAGSAGFGGDIFMQTSAGDISVRDIDAGGGQGGGSIELRGNEAVSIAGKLIANGSGARIAVTGCGVDVSTTGSLSSTGMLGANSLLARGRLTVRGPVTAGMSNRIEFRSASLPPQITAPVVPSTAPVLNTNLPACGAPVPTTTTTTITTSTTTTTRPPTTTTTIGTTTTTRPPTTTTTIGTTTTTRPPTTTTTIGTTTTTRP